MFSSPNSREIRIVDFGISGLYTLYNAEKSLAGSLKYMAPEILTGKNTAADPSIDIFSLGVILFALVTGKLPFDGSDTESIRKKIIKGVYTYPESIKISAECKDLIKQMLEMDFRKRITMKLIFGHPWVEPFSRKLSPLIRYGTFVASSSSS